MQLKIQYNIYFFFLNKYYAYILISVIVKIVLINLPCSFIITTQRLASAKEK